MGFVICCFVIGFQKASASPVNDSLLAQLDATMARAEVFIRQKEATLQALTLQGRDPGLSDEGRFRFNSRLLEAYRQYRFDSALHYVEANLRLAQKLQKKVWVQASVLQISEVLISGGMYKEAVEYLNTLKAKELDDSLRKEYYHDQKLVYEALREYAKDAWFAPVYAQKARNYQDSLLAILPPASNQYRIELGIQQMNEGKLDAAEAILMDLYQNHLVQGSPQFAGATAILSYLFRLKGKVEEERRFRILSAIADVHAVIKENTSLTELAVRLYEEGEIDRANAYIAYAMADANFFNARQRKIEIAKIYPIITRAYQQETKKQESRLRWYIGLVTGISFLLGFAFIALYWQKRKLGLARAYLHELNQEMSLANKNLQDLNQKLKEANFIKEEYIGQFLSQCSAYIDKLEAYQKRVQKLLAARQLNELQKQAESTDFIKNELAEFYHLFDEAFLKLFPDFVQRFNRLLEPEEAIQLKKGELLSTELRIFALIRLGITDSYKIAHFLRYSPNTIYNYRSQVKNKARVDREQFEKWVQKIGTEPE
jgi:hypothetical protein